MLKTLWLVCKRHGCYKDLRLYISKRVFRMVREWQVDWLRWERSNMMPVWKIGGSCWMGRNPLENVCWKLQHNIIRIEEGDQSKLSHVVSKREYGRISYWTRN